MAIQFGTGGLRGLMGEGADRVNARTVARASRGVAAWALEMDAARAGQGGVAIAFDTRRQSDALARAAADAFAEAGLPVWLFGAPTPTPVLSFAVRHMGCAAGVVVTASHNPKEYNGYKVYNRDGCQLVPREADAVSARIAGADDSPAPPSAGVRAVPDSVGEAFLAAVLAQSRLRDAGAARALRAVYTPLHGTGAGYVPEALRRAGFSPSVVAAQAAPDGDFSTVRSPNPEDRQALTLAIAQAEAEGADIALGTDPDCDRVGAAVRHAGAFRLITGNQMGALLMDFLARDREALPPNGAVVRTIVTSELGAAVARDAGLTVLETLTGFKYIGEQIGEFERTGAHAFVFGYEESYGYLVGTHARDKDAVVASLLICEMAAWHRQRGHTLADALESLYARYGVYADHLDSIEIDSLARTDAALRALRRTGGALFDPPARVRDYARGLSGLPPSDVLKYLLPDGSWVAVRPSGTEPKLKIYYSVRGNTPEAASGALATLRGRVRAAVREGGRRGANGGRGMA